MQPQMNTAYMKNISESSSDRARRVKTPPHLHRVKTPPSGGGPKSQMSPELRNTPNSNSAPNNTNYNTTNNNENNNNARPGLGLEERNGTTERKGSISPPATSEAHPGTARTRRLSVSSLALHHNDFKQYFSQVKSRFESSDANYSSVRQPPANPAWISASPSPSDPLTARPIRSAGTALPSSVGGSGGNNHNSNTNTDFGNSSRVQRRGEAGVHSLPQVSSVSKQEVAAEAGIQRMLTYFNSLQTEKSHQQVSFIHALPRATTTTTTTTTNNNNNNNNDNDHNNNKREPFVMKSASEPRDRGREARGFRENNQKVHTNHVAKKLHHVVQSEQSTCGFPKHRREPEREGVGTGKLPNTKRRPKSVSYGSVAVLPFAIQMSKCTIPKVGGLRNMVERVFVRVCVTHRCVCT